MNEKQQLLNQIAMTGFGVDEMALFLDTHPHDQAALSFYRQYVKLRDQAIALYTDLYGPLTVNDNQNPNCWDWVSGPWPWQCGQ